MVEIFAGYDTEIGISELITEEEEYSISGNDNIKIDNIGNKKVFPIIEITSSSSGTLNSISNDDKQTIEIDKTIDDTDILILDFKKQVYELNDDNIISDLNFPDDELLHFIQNNENILNFDVEDDLDIKISYDTYSIAETQHYVENFRINKSPDYEEVKPINKNKISNRKQTVVKYNFTLRKLSIDWLDESKEYRISYHEYNPDTYTEFKKYLVNVSIDDIRRGHRSPEDFVTSDVSGTAVDLITQKIN
ncbi:MAG: phage distal tail protein [Nanoarchaeota archaeon]